MNERQIVGYSFLTIGLILMLTNNHLPAILFNSMAVGIFLTDMINKKEK
jgi:hypothetical protein